MNSVDRQYVELMSRILSQGTPHEDRTGEGTVRVWVHHMRFDLQEGFPLITVKKAPWKKTLAELLWFISGSTNVADLEYIYEPAAKWWRPFAKENGDLGPMYGEQYRHFVGVDPDTVDFTSVDQIARLIRDLKRDPHSRRLLLTTYNPADAPHGALYPCHGLSTQFQVVGKTLHCATVQRSADMMLGVPANIASYAMLTHMIAQVCGLEVGHLCYTFNDAHIYMNHIEGAREVVRRAEEEELFPLATLHMNEEIDDIEKFTLNDIWVGNYQSLPYIAAPMAL